MSELAIILSSVAFIFSAITAVFSFYAYSYMVGVSKSTHQVQLVPAEEMANNPTGMNLAKAFAGLDPEQEQV